MDGHRVTTLKLDLYYINESFMKNSAQYMYVKSCKRKVQKIVFPVF